ncbi:MAG: hypothetical protein AABY22_15790, partial [Nanoarchaeota archaeon]
LGIDIKIKRFIGVFIDKFQDQGDWYNALCLHYLVNIERGEPKPLQEASDIQWFPLNNLPKRISYKSNRKVLALFQK